MVNSPLPTAQTMFGMTTGLSGEQQNKLANAYVGKNASVSDMMSAGLTNTEAQTINHGFDGIFGDAAKGAHAWRDANGYSTDDMGNVTYKATTPVNQQIASSVNNPTAPANTTLTPILQQSDSKDTLNPSTYNLNGTVSVPGTAAQAQSSTITGAAPVQTATVDPSTAANGVSAQTMTSTLTDPNAVGQGVAAQGTVNTLATVQGQLASLYASANGTVPPWAMGAYQAATGYMAARGISSSSIAAGAVTTAYMQSATNIAAADASTYFQMDTKNLDNRQQMNLQNLQIRQQDMLTDTSIANATANFNATSIQQSQQYVASLVNSIKTQNAASTNAINQFNTTQANSIAAQNASNTQATSIFNAQQTAQADQFNATMENNRQQFNSSMAYAVDQSNVLWQRSVNTANTAAVNAANNTNVQNLFNLSQSSLNQVWQEMQDNASYAFQASQTAAQMQYNLALNSGSQAFLQQLSSNGDMAKLSGSFFTNALALLGSPASSSKG